MMVSFAMRYAFFVDMAFLAFSKWDSNTTLNFNWVQIAPCRGVLTRALGFNIGKGWWQCAQIASRIFVCDSKVNRHLFCSKLVFHTNESLFMDVTCTTVKLLHVGLSKANRHKLSVELRFYLDGFLSSDPHCYGELLHVGEDP